jgi:RNA polymerase sigma-70 factor, ECF subfamily
MTKPTFSAGQVPIGESSVERPEAAAEQALLESISTGDRLAIEQLYVLYFARLAQFFEHVTLRLDYIDELINDTMFEVWKARNSFSTSTPVHITLMRMAHSRAQQYLGEAGTGKPPLQSDTHDWYLSEPMIAPTHPSELQSLLSALPVEERAVLHLVYGSGYSRRDTADVMTITCEYLDVLLSNVRARAKLYFGTTSANANKIDDSPPAA